MKKNIRSRRNIKSRKPKSLRLKTRFAELEEGQARIRAIMDEHRRKVQGVRSASPQHYTMPQIEQIVEADKAHAKKGFFGKLFSRRLSISQSRRHKKSKKSKKTKKSKRSRKY